MSKRKTFVSRNLRKQSTPWERKLWNIFRNRQFADYKFRRQHPIGPYIVDICCPAKKLIIELDGGQHNETLNIESDLIRQTFLENRGFKVLRVWNNQVDNNLDGVTQVILEGLEKNSSPPTLSSSRGEGGGKKMISLIAAVAKNNVIGYKNDLPWDIPEDLKRFKKLTMGKTILMGQNTFESILKRAGKPLPGRKNVLLTRDGKYPAPAGVSVYTDLTKALRDLEDEDLFIIGGAEVFRQTINLAGRLYITEIDLDVPGDAFFPEIDSRKWKKHWEEQHKGFSFLTYKRI